MNLGNGLDLSIKRSYYNKTIVGEDGITQTVDTKHQYPLYQLQISKNYFNTDDKQVVQQIVSDLKGLVNELEKLESRENKDIESEK